jgi:hypothetical protein
VRWSYESPFQTKCGQQSQFDPNSTDALTGLPGAIVHSPGSLNSNNYKHFQPRRLGLQTADNMVFRAGFGITTIDPFQPLSAGSSGYSQNFREYHQ